MTASTPTEDAATTQCACCGASFECGAARGDCWCAALPPLSRIEPGRACLCPGCLAEELRRTENPPA